MSDTQTRLDEIAELNPTRALKKGKMTSFVEMASLPTNSRDIENIAQKEFSGSGSKFKNGDILFARITPCLENGKTAKVAGLQHDEIAHGSTEFIVLSAREPEFDEDYLYYFCRLSEFRNYAKSRMEGTSGRQRVSWQALAEFEFDFPDKEIRKKAADMLKIFDDKIQLNTQTNQTLEAIAQAIFKSWFVDFDPVRAKAAALSEGKSEYEANLAAMSVICGKDTSELNDTEYKALWQIAEAFPSELVENIEFGEVPKGWENTTLSEICSMQNGYAFKSNEWTGSGIPVIKIGSVKPMIVDIESNGFVSEENEHIRSDFLLKQGDIVVGLTGYVGEVGRIPAGDKAMLNQRVAKFVPKKLDHELSYYNFVYCLARQRTFKEYAELNAKGSAQANISTRELLNYSICLASLEVHKFFEIKINELLYKILTNSQESKVLEKTRDLLLPKLLSGGLSNE